MPVEEKIDADTIIAKYTFNEFTPPDIDVLTNDLNSCFNIDKATGISALQGTGFTFLLLSSDASRTLLSFCNVNEIVFNGQNICEIWNVCTPVAYRKRGFASKMISYLIVNYSRLAAIWLCTDDEKNLSLYTKLGFVKPALTNVSITGSQLGRSTVELIYDGSATDADKRNARSIGAKLFALKDLVAQTGSQYMTFKLNKDFLKDFYLGTKLTTDNVEYCGELILNGDELQNKHLHKGTRMACQLPFTPVVFHSHPRSAYEDSKIGLNPVSVQDLVRELLVFSQLSIVLSFEGIYTIQLYDTVAAYAKILMEYSPGAHQQLMTCLRIVLEKCAAAVGGDLMKLYDQFFMKGLTSDTFRYLVGKSSQFLKVSNVYIQKLLTLYTSVTIQDVINEDTTGIIDNSLKQFDKNIDTSLHMFYMTFVSGVLKEVEKGKSIKITYRVSA